MLKKSISSIFYFIVALFFIILGFFLIFSSESTMKTILMILSIGMIVVAFLRFFVTFFQKKNRNGIWIRSFLELIFGFYLTFHIDKTIDVITVLFGFYLLCHAFLHYMNHYLYQLDRIPNRLGILINGLIDMIFGFCLIFNPDQNLKYAAIVIGIYFIFYGLMNFNDFLSEIVPKKYQNRFKNKIRIPLPIIFTFLIPQQLLNSINDSLKTKQDSSILSIKKEKGKTDLSVFIHLAKTGSASFGHVDLSYKGKIYSYANYDKHSRRFMDAVGDGVIAVCNKKKYIEYMTTKKGRYLVEFGISLSDKQKEKVEKKIEELIHWNTIPYEPDLQLADKGMIPREEFKDMASELYKYANAKFYKIMRGKHKTYFVFKTNCVVVVESVLGSLGTFLPQNGIISPGTYYDYLNNEFMKKNSKVISRKIYTKESLRGKQE